MRYALLIYQDEETPEPDRLAERLAAYTQFEQHVEERGVGAGAFRLRPTATATTVRVRAGDTVIKDGPFAETKEQIAGLYLVECKDLDEVIETAAKIPSAQWGTIEVRPVWEM